MKTVYLYGKNVPKSGKSVFEFGGISMCHRSLVADKCDILVHVESGIIARAYPAKTERSVILDDMAQNMKLIEHFIRNTESYSIEERPAKLKIKKDNDADVEYDIKMTHYSDGSCVEPTVGKSPIVQKKYNQKEFKW